MKSTREPMAFCDVRTPLTVKGASGDVVGIDDDEPMCMHRTVPVSAQASKTGSQWFDLWWIDGSPRGWGFSGKVTATAPLAAQRRISAAAAAVSHSGRITAP